MPHRRAILILAAVTVALWGALLTTVAVQRLDGDPRGFIRPGLRYYHGPAFEDIAQFGPRGYDGEFYAALATDPLLLNPDTTRGIDAPAYRARRIGLPLLAWACSLGNGRLAIYAYVGLCVLGGLLAIGIVAASLARLGRSPWWAALLLPSAGLAASIVRATPDAAACALIAGALLLHGSGRRRASLSLITLAVLVRETSLLAAAALAWSDWRAGERRAAALHAFLPAGVLALWLLRLNGLGGTGLGGNFALPFSWLPAKLEAHAALRLLDPDLWGALAALAAMVLPLAALVGRRLEATELTLLLFSLLALSLSAKVMVDPWAYARVLALLPMLALVTAARTTGARRIALAAVPVLFALAGTALLRPVVILATERATPTRLATGIGVKGAGPRGAVPEVRERGRAALLLPVALDRGEPGWRTDIEVENTTDGDAAVVFELLKSGEEPFPWPCRIRLAPGQRLELPDALGRLFAWSGHAALRATIEQGEVRLRSRTRSRGSTASWRDAFPERAAQSSDTLELGEPGADGAVLSVGFVNVGDAPIEIRSEGGQTELARLPPWRMVERRLPRCVDGVCVDRIAAAATAPFVAYVAVEDGAGVRVLYP